MRPVRPPGGALAEALLRVCVCVSVTPKGKPDAGRTPHVTHDTACVLKYLHIGRRSARDELMNARSMSSEPTAAAGASRDRTRVADRRSVSVMEHPSRAGHASAAATAQPLLS